jgi:DNA repair photolyase
MPSIPRARGWEIADVRLYPVDNPPNPYHTRHAEWLEPPPPARIHVYEETARSILSENESPDLPFRWSVNPYRGCQHACAYCYARRYHEYLDWGAGTDFETKLVAKINAPQLLREAFSSRKWRGEAVNFSGVTDCYQPIEASYELTRKCLEVCVAFSNPAAVVTKGFLVVRDADLLAELRRRAHSSVYISIPFANGEMSRLIEPQAPPPERRFEALRRLRDAGVRVGVLVAPLIPGLNDEDIPDILHRAAAAGASTAGMQMLRLSGNVREVFLRRLREAVPLRADRVIERIRDARGGALNDAKFCTRMVGSGPYWDGVVRLFEVHAQRLGLNQVTDLPTADRRATPRPHPHPHAATETAPAQHTFDFDAA